MVKRTAGVLTVNIIICIFTNWTHVYKALSYQSIYQFIKICMEIYMNSECDYFGT